MLDSLSARQLHFNDLVAPITLKQQHYTNITINAPASIAVWANNGSTASDSRTHSREMSIIKEIKLVRMCVITIHECELYIEKSQLRNRDVTVHMRRRN